MRRGLDLTVHRYGRRQRLCRRVRIGLLAAACALLAGLAVLRLGPTAAAYLTGLPRQAEAALGDWLMPHFSRQLTDLEAQNARLRSRLAAMAGLQAENQALRQLLDSPRAEQAAGAQPLPVVRRSPEGLALAGSARAGQAVLDPQGRFIGRTVSDPDAEPGTLPVEDADGTPCLAGGLCGVLTRENGSWYLDGLPRHSGLAAGCLVTTPDGHWVGVLAAPPTEDSTGLCGRAPLTDTADPDAGVLFVVG